MDATVSPQDIAYPMDLNLLNASRQIAEKRSLTFFISPARRSPELTINKLRKEYLRVA